MINKLVSYLKECDDAYYGSSNTKVSDATYDALVETLRRLDPTNEYLKKIGSKVKSDKVGRLIPMGTLTKYHTSEDIQKWLYSETCDILLAPKYDGFAVELLYDKGVLVSASTRGDGYVGEDVLPAIKEIESIPQFLNRYRADMTIIRGEAIIPVRNHDKIKELGYTAMRNAVPGIVRSNRKGALQYVDFVAYEFIDGSHDRLVDQRGYYDDMFIIEDYHIYQRNSIKDMEQRREELRATNYTYELDGVVLKTREVKEDDLLHPSHMISWKYKSNRETTILLDIEYSMGVTGYFTPIGIFDEVEFQGAKLTRASLGNITRMKNEFEGMTLSSIIEVSRRGDIIPYIETLIMVDENNPPINYPEVCPYCGQPLAMDGFEPHCINKSCPERLRLQISQYVKSIGIKGIGDALIRGLIDAKYINQITDVYTIDPLCILSLPRQGQSSVEKWALLQSKYLTVAELLSAYPFLNLGRKIWDLVLTRFTFDDIINISEDDIRRATLRGIGDSKINDIVTQISENRDELIAISKYVLNL